MSGGSGSWVAACWLGCVFLGMVSGSSAASSLEAASPPLVADRTQAPSSMVVLREQLDTTALGSAGTVPHAALPKSLRGSDVYDALRVSAMNSQTEVIRWLESRGLAYRAYWIANMIQVEASPGQLVELESWPAVDRIVDDAPMRIDEAVRVDEEEIPARRFVEWNVDLIDAPSVWSAGTTGAGVVIGLVDTGAMWDHPALIDQYRGWNGSSADHNYHWHDAVTTGGGSCGPSTTEPCDAGGHGTLVLGSAVGDDGGSNQIGVAPNAQWIGCRAWDESVGTSLSFVTECLQWMLAPTDLTGSNPDPAKAPDVINNSWVCEPSEGCADPLVLQTMVQNLRAAGIAVVAGAGNDGSACSSLVYPPAIYEESFSIGASNIDDQLSFFSSRGPVTIDGSGRLKPDVVAPGQNIRSSANDGGYENGWSGTSLASPHVAGVMALMIAANEDLRGQVWALEDILERTAVPIVAAQTCDGIPGTSFPNPMVGHGRIDAFAAFQEALLFSAVDVPELPEVGDGQDGWTAGGLGVRVVPNPARRTARLELAVETASVIDIELFDAAGRKVRALVAKEPVSEGSHQWSWDGRVDSGALAPAGTYFVRARASKVQPSLAHGDAYRARTVRLVLAR